ncbi:peroxide stress protein YaaA [Stieleria sp. JC731]|uniref:peroxide stress protein YaaA n=1 Tax=Pirellulaceae TaxID=2691357 RepID=UPI001E655D53|nr:peroxide stress protein YaaA [Stieleria sp. JC731]MCC9599276.1 peroxide stress protein YaaA [Stieleria sp. JC731]
MLLLLSPSKRLDYDTPVKSSVKTTPEFIDQSARLARELKKLTPKQISALMGINDELALLNHERFQDWQSPMPDADTRQAALAFKGDVYFGLEAETLTAKQLEYAQDHLRILSGLYGILRPLDGILPYRLEMGTKLKNKAGKDLYQFWGSSIAESINRQLDQIGSRIVLNCASNEYFKAIDKKTLDAEVVSPVFKDMTKGSYRIVTVYAKKARGTMAAWVIRKKAKTLKKLKQFDGDGYRYDEESSTDTKPVFLRG